MAENKTKTVDTSALNKVSWTKPAPEVQPQVTLPDLLRGLQLLATDDDREAAADPKAQKWDSETPASMQVIRSGALSVTKTGTRFIAGAGGLSVLTATVGSSIAAATSNLGEPVVVSVIGGVALFLSAVAIALALFIKGDLEARCGATAARFRARGDVTAAFLQATAALPQSPATGSAKASPSQLAEQVLIALAGFPGKGQGDHGRRWDVGQAG